MISTKYGIQQAIKGNNGDVILDEIIENKWLADKCWEFVKAHTPDTMYAVYWEMEGTAYIKEIDSINYD